MNLVTKSFKPRSALYTFPSELQLPSQAWFSTVHGGVQHPQTMGRNIDHHILNGISREGRVNGELDVYGLIWEVSILVVRVMKYIIVSILLRFLTSLKFEKCRRE